MTDPDRAEHPDATLDELERYVDPDRPPAPWTYPLVGVAAGLTVVLVWVLPGLWGLGVALLAGAAGLGYDARLRQRHRLPRLWQLPPSVRRGQLLLAASIPVLVLSPLLFGGFLPGVSETIGAIVAGVAVAVVIGVGGPITDRRARANARELLR